MEGHVPGHAPAVGADPARPRQGAQVESRARPERRGTRHAARTGEPGLATAFIAEALGTFALTTVAAGGEMVFRMGVPDGPNIVARAVAPGLLVAAFIYALGDASGAHFNPSVTMAFALKGLFPWRRVPGYWVSQFGGAVLAALLLRAILGNVGELGSTIPHVSTGAAAVLEVVLTWTLVTVILGTADRYRLIGPNAALAVGATIALCGLWAGPLDGASMNPARSLGPAIVSGALAPAWVYVLGPAVGAVAAVLTTVVLHGTRHHDAKQREAAQGERQSAEEAPRRTSVLQELPRDVGSAPGSRRVRPDAGG